MPNSFIKESNKFILAIHSTKNYFGFGYKPTTGNKVDEKIFIKKFDRDLSNNLPTDLYKFISVKSFHSVERITVSTGPANFNASRLIITLARTLSQQLNCSLDGFSSFKIMGKRIAIKNNINELNKPFWIINQLKKRGFISGKYCLASNKISPDKIFIKELIRPKIFEEIPTKELYFEAEYDVQEDLRELLSLSFENYYNSITNKWDQVLPIYPLSAIN